MTNSKRSNRRRDSHAMFKPQTLKLSAFTHAAAAAAAAADGSEEGRLDGAPGRGASCCLWAVRLTQQRQQQQHRQQLQQEQQQQQQKSKQPLEQPQQWRQQREQHQQQRQRQQQQYWQHQHHAATTPVTAAAAAAARKKNGAIRQARFRHCRKFAGSDRGPARSVSAVSPLSVAGLRLVCACWRALGRAPLGGPLRRQQQQVVLLGPSSSGKTCCFLALRNGRGTPTVSSLEANKCSIPLSRIARNAAAAAARKGAGGKEAAAAAAEGEDSASPEVSLPGRDASVELIDCPGHLRLRPKALAAAATSSALIFFVDAADKPALKNAAEFLFELFCLPAIHERRPPMLLVANKMDLPEARGQRAVVEDLEKEIERCRVSRQLTFEGEDAAACFLGREGSRFLLHDDSPCPLEVCCAAVRDDDFTRVSDFIIEHCSH
ncbi:hypothetical protein Esti_002227 [Eimeria stiedai]